MKKILVFCDWYLPGYKAGGPIQSVRNFIRCFHTEFDIYVVTSDRDLGDSIPYANVTADHWIQGEGCRIIYLSPANRKLVTYRKLLEKEKFDGVYFNSFFSLPFTLKPLWVCRRKNIRMVLAPRGMLGEGALQQKSLKKKIFLGVIKTFNLFRNVIFQATSEEEKQEIVKYFGNKNPIILAQNLTSQRLEHNMLRTKEVNSVNLFFLSRIARKKNLLNAIQWLASINPKYKVDFNIYGPVDEEEYYQACQSMILNLPTHIKTTFLGPVNNNYLEKYLSKEHFLFLPTLNENYGHTIAESLQYGLPVIISDRTPWRKLQRGSSKYQISGIKNQDTRQDAQEQRTNFEPPTSNAASQPLNIETFEPTFPTSNPNSVGWDLPLENPEAFVKVIEYCAAMGQEEYLAMSNRAFEYAREVLNDPGVVEANRGLFGEGEY